MGGHAEIVTFSERNNIQIQVFDSLSAQHPIVRIKTGEGGHKLSLLFSRWSLCLNNSKIWRRSRTRNRSYSQKGGFRKQKADRFDTNHKRE